MKKAIKITSIILFVVFYILNLETSDFPSPAYSKNQFLSFVISLLALLSFLFLTFAFSQSKRYLISVSVFWVWLVGSIVLYILEIDYSSSIVIELFIHLPLLIYALPFKHFDGAIQDLLYLLNVNINKNFIDFIVLIHVGIVVVLFYATYFISRKIITRKIEDKTKKDIL